MTQIPRFRILKVALKRMSIYGLISLFTYLITINLVVEKRNDDPRKVDQKVLKDTLHKMKTPLTYDDTETKNMLLFHKHASQKRNVEQKTQLINSVKLADTLEKGYLLENSQLCSSVKNLSLLIILHTAADHFIRRMDIRRTYANTTVFKSLRVMFLLGTTNAVSVQDKIVTEFKQYRDILQGDFLDTYRNLTNKGVMGYKWIQERCRNAKVILKVDDDVVVNSHKILKEILPSFQNKSKSILCNHILPYTMPIIRDKRSKWYVAANEFKGQNNYPEYCSGFFVMITNDVIPAIYRAAFKTPFFWIDDVYLYGLLPGKYNDITYTSIGHKVFTLIPNKAIHCFRNTSRTCEYLVTGTYSTNHFKEIWKYMTQQYVNITA